MLERLLFGFRKTVLYGLTSITLAACGTKTNGNVEDSFVFNPSNQYDAGSYQDSSSLKEVDETNQYKDIKLEEICTKKTYFLDSDGDNFGVKGSSIFECEKPLGYSEKFGDCDDSNAAINPAAIELCNNIDDNCNGQIDEGFSLQTLYPDKDKDKFGDKNALPTYSCNDLEGFVKDNTDCDDNNFAINPLALEICNKIDDNCNTQIDEGLSLQAFYPDNDKDTFGDKNATPTYSCNDLEGLVKNNSDCDDNNAAINPATLELCNSIDDNCNNQIDEGLPFQKLYADKDKDGFGDQKSSIDLCKDLDGYIKDKNDCNDNNPLVNPNALEICNNIDDNCKNGIDEGLTVTCKTACGNGLEECIDGIMKECTAPKPQLEVCDGLDNNCNGVIDDGIIFQQWYKDTDKDSFGNPKDWVSACNQPIGYVSNKDDCNDSDPNINLECCIPQTKKDCLPCGPYDFIFVIDNSGSMDYNDAKKIRYQGIDQIIDAWNPNNEATLVPFADIAKSTGPFDWSQPILHNYVQIASNMAVGGGTNIGNALEFAFNQFLDNGYDRVVILLTDGGTSSYDSQKYPTSQLNQTAKDNQILVYTMGLGSVDSTYLNQISLGIGTYTHLNTVDDVLITYNQIFGTFECSQWKECSDQQKWVEKTAECPGFKK